ncbi:hypothetical protein [Parasphingorhabdus sp.]|uniref:hypothetical protein n=1 Tax=Parasphingorhabdus sp. TaxID=2709688 RepID=UPI002B26A0FF|nr:hypothetical protein [Parasphingorhabdus sp.]
MADNFLASIKHPRHIDLLNPVCIIERQIGIAFGQRRYRLALLQRLGKFVRKRFGKPLSIRVHIGLRIHSSYFL